MKTAVSIPDEVFARAERLARRLKKSRSRLFAEALEEYVRRHDPGEVTAAMDAVCEEVGDDADLFLAKVTRQVLERSEW